MAVRILVVDDSAFMRKAISVMLEEEPDFRVAATAKDGIEAIEMTRKYRPDIITMDIEMPRMDGITALKEIMSFQPTPVLVISSLTVDGAEATVKAMQAGAVDFIPKQLSFVSLDIIKIKKDLIEKIRAIAGSKSSLFGRGDARRAGQASAVPQGRRFRFPSAQFVAIGVSTGGPFSLQKLIPKLPASFPIPIAIVQHMPPHFTRSMAERLNQLSALTVREAEEAMELTPGLVLIAPGGKHLHFRKRGAKVVAHISGQPADTLFKPSVDVMFRSAHDVFGGDILAVVMTGMGKDGLEGARLIKQSGGRVIAQDEQSCVVYGMPKTIVVADLADLVLPLEDIPKQLTRTVSRLQAVS